jgi:two-component system sensor histidine kinase KdpD
VVYIPGVLLTSTIWGWRLGLVSAVLSALAFNWFHIPPAGQLEIAADRDAVALVNFWIVALASSSLSR